MKKTTLLLIFLTALTVILSCQTDDDIVIIPDFSVNVTAYSTDSASITWTALSGSTHYNVYLDQVLQEEFVTDLNYSFSNLNNNTLYTGRVDAVSENGDIESVNFQFTTLDLNNQSLPSDFNVSIKHLGHISTTIQWTNSTVPNGDPITYSVYLEGSLIESNLTTLEYYIPSLQANTSYNGTVRAYNNNVYTESAFSFTTVPSNVFDGRATLKTQQEVDDFVANHYTEITDWLIIGTTTVTSDITDIGGLQTLVNVTGSLFVAENPVLETSHGLQNITNNLNAIAIANNDLLNNLIGFSGISVLDSYINIVNNPEITTLDQFSGMNSGVLNVNVELTNNDKLVDIDGLSQLELFSVYIRDHALLENIDLITSADSNTLGQLYILNNEILYDFSPLSNITLVKGDLTIGYSNLTNLDDLSNLNRTFGDVNIWYNDALVDLCGLQNIVQNDNIDGVYNIHDNAFNPTFQNVLGGNCAQ